MDIEISPLQAQAFASLAEQRKLAVTLFRPLAHQEEIFRQPRPKFMLVCGGNRGGKTITLLELIAAFAMDLPITFSNGEKHDARMPWQKGKHVEIWIVCIDSDHIGRVLHNGLFKAGFFERFRTIYDPKTKALRLFSHKTDDESKSKPHPPLIPKSYIDKFAWEDYAKRIFKSVTIKNPRTGEPMATIRAFTSKGDAPQGSAVDMIMIDEQLARKGFVTELQMRLVDKRGQLVWSSWNADDSDEEDDLNRFNAMIDRELELGSGIAKRVQLTLSDNSTMTRQQIEETLSGCSTEEERLQRDLGIRPSEKLRMYPLFSKTAHCVEGWDDELEAILEERDGIPPNTWTKTLVLDPGTQSPAVLLCAVPPPELGEYYVPYMEFYPGRADPWQLAKLVAEHTQDELFWKFIIDSKAGRQQTMGMRDGAKVQTQYEDAFFEYGVTCVSTKSRFVWGSSNVGGRQLVLQGWMHSTPTGPPKLRIITKRCPELCKQLVKLKKKVANKEVMDDRKAAGTPSDVVDALEYFAASGPRYINVPKPKIPEPDCYKRYMKKFGSKDSEAVQIGTRY